MFHYIVTTITLHLAVLYLDTCRFLAEIIPF